jgi:hypothetical protein
MELGGQGHAPAALPPGKRPGTHLTGGWVSPRACLDSTKNLAPHRDSIPGSSSPPITLSQPTILKDWKNME